jgi:hypothetical protein
MTSYVTLEEFQNYVDGFIIDTDDFDAATPPMRQKALNIATRSIDRLNFEGDLTDPAQPNQFPRGGDTTVPTAIKNATCEIALVLLTSTLDIESDKLATREDAFLAVKTARDTNAVSENVVNGIVSFEAWLLLKPFLRPYHPEIVRA